MDLRNEPAATSFDLLRKIISSSQADLFDVVVILFFCSIGDRLEAN